MKDTIFEFRDEYRWLSNFWPAKVEFMGFEYPTVEHGYQAAKTMNADERLVIREALYPAQAKRLGRYVTVRPDWDQVKLEVMFDLVTQKFCNLELCRKLLATGDMMLVEGNYWNDTFWGVCNGHGTNHLGRILMRVRDNLRKGRGAP